MGLFTFGCLVYLLSASVPSQEVTTGAEPEAQAPGAQPTWAIDPSDPGDDIPAVGRSLFDQLVIQGGKGSPSYTLPFPFSALLKQIEQTARAQAVDPHFSLVVIPFGRSLHRYAAKPEYLHFPRILATVDRETGVSLDSRQPTPPFLAPPPVHLQDRLFLAYQETAAIIEVISYNEAAGRFEFQIVRNYRPDAIPQVVYANRKVCTVCHQQHAPIFPEPLWNETNANPAVQQLLTTIRPELAAWAHGVDIAAAYDAATDHANDLLVAQKLWQEGCSVECRGTWLTLALQQALTGYNPFLPTPPRSPQQDQISDVLQEWQSQWPSGIWLPNPNIPNRPATKVLAFLSTPVPPLPGFSPVSTDRSPGHPLMDPVTPRPPLATLTFDPRNPSSGIHILTTLATMFSPADLQALDHHLRNLARTRHLPPRQLTSRCQTRLHPESNGVVEGHLECHPLADSSSEASSSFSLSGRVIFKQGHFHHGTVHRLHLDPQEEHAHLRLHTAGVPTDSISHRLTLQLRQSSSDLSARTYAGNRLQSVVLDPFPGWVDPEASSGTLLVSDGTLTILPDFSLLHQTVQAMISDTIQGRTEVLGQVPFQRVNLLESLLHHRHVPSSGECCAMPADLPPPVQDRHPSAVHPIARDPAHSSPLQLLNRYCGDCHHGVDHAPPNFLHGSTEQVARNLTHCAERIHVRLNAWQLPPDKRLVAPMPPPTALPRLTPTSQAWPDQEEFRRMVHYIQKLLTQKTETVVSDTQSLLNHYEILPDCLPFPAVSIVSHPDF